MLARLGPAADRLAGLPEPSGHRPPPELRHPPARVDAGELGAELDRVGALRALHLPLGFLSEVDESAGLPGLHRLFAQIELLERLRALELPADVFAEVPDATVQCWRHRALRGLPNGLARLPLLAALCRYRERELAHALLLVLLDLIDVMHERVRARLQHRFADARGLTRETVLMRLVDATVRGRIDRFSSAAPELRGMLLEADAITRTERARTARGVLRSVHSADRRQLTAVLLRALEFRGGPASWPLLAALGELRDDAARVWGRGRFFPPEQEIPLDDVVPEQWRPVVVDRHGRIDRAAYELAALFGLREALSRGEITAPAADPPEPERIVWPAEPGRCAEPAG